MEVNILSPEPPLSEPFEVEGLDGVYRASEFTLDQWRRLQEVDEQDKSKAMALAIAMGLRYEDGRRVFDDRRREHIDALMQWPIRAAMSASSKIFDFNTPAVDGEDAEGKGGDTR